MIETLRMKGRNGDEIEFLCQSGAVYVLLSWGRAHQRFLLRGDEFDELVKRLAQWRGEKAGRCPSCARDDRDLASAFCESHRNEYKLRQADAMGDGNHEETVGRA